MSVANPIPVGIEHCACLTALGDASETQAALLESQVGLRKVPVLGSEGGLEVPLGLIGYAYDETLPPRWQEPLDEMVAAVPSEPWGSESYPVFLTSSNFDVGSLYAYRRSGDERFLEMGTPGRSLDKLGQRYGWGPNRLAFSHACVTAQVAIDVASERLRSGVAKKVLIVSFDFVSPFVAGGFHSLKILNEQFPVPFVEREVGSIGLGDGIATLVLSLDEAPCRIVSNFLYNEMFHFTANEPEGSGFRKVTDWIKQEIGESSLWVKGHGTGTLDSGRLEALAFQDAFPESPLLSWKGSLGHTLGSCAAVELAIVVESLRRKQVPGGLSSEAKPMSANVCQKSFDPSTYNYAALVSNAFGGAHAGCLLSYD